LEEAMTQKKKDGDLPDRRKHGYAELEAELEKHVSEIDHRFKKRYRGMLIAFATIGLTSFVALYGYGVVLHRQKEITRSIQTQRRESIKKTCSDQNDRNRNTTRALIKVAQPDIDASKTQAGKNELQRRRNVTLKLVNALQPTQDCDALVKKLVKGSG
jgi:hypothetical protein